MSENIIYVQWEHEDELPQGLNNEEYKAMFEFSQVKDKVGCRVFPYIEMQGQKYYIGDNT